MKSTAAYPEWPDHVGKDGRAKDPDGKLSKYTIMDEICISQSDAPHKLIYLQKIHLESNKKIELRLYYYIIGKSGRWVFGRFATFIPPGDYEKITIEAKRRGWIK